jgi:hypothetical protein
MDLQGCPAQIGQLMGSDAASLASVLIMLQPLLALALPCC